MVEGIAQTGLVFQFARTLAETIRGEQKASGSPPEQGTERGSLLCCSAERNFEETLQITESCHRVVVVVHEPVMIIATCRALIDDFANNLESGPAVMEPASNIDCCFLQRTIDAP